MAFKTITIDLEAYELLKGRKRGRQSFSEVIKSELKRRTTGRDLASTLHRVQLEEKTLDAVDRLILKRSRSRATAPRL